MGIGKRALDAMVMPSPEFWQNKRVLVTGHTGFKGCWLALWLAHMGARVSGLALEPPSQPNLFDLACQSDLEQHHLTDIRQLEAVCEAVSQTRPEIVFHLAAQALVRPSYEDPVGTYATNVMGTIHVMEAVRRVGGVKAVVNVTSDKCYENREFYWAYRECEPMGGDDPYSSSKGCAELVTAAYRKSFFGPQGGAASLASARAGNVIGGGDWGRDRLIPDCIRAFSSGQTVVVRSPTAIRPWQHVLEPLCGYLILAQALCNEDGFDQAWNFGPSAEDSIPVSRVVQAMCDLWGDGAAWRISHDPQPHEATYLKVDPSQARARLGWVCRLDMDKALTWTTNWYKRQLAGDDARELCLEQIRQYQALGNPS